MYEIIWKSSSIPGISELTTLEKQHLITAKFPELTSSYSERIRREKEEKKASKKIAKGSLMKLVVGHFQSFLFSFSIATGRLWSGQYRNINFMKLE